MADKHGKTEKPTPKKLQDARKKGQVARTADLSPWVALLVGTYLVPMAADGVVRMGDTAMAGLRGIAADPDPNVATRLMTAALIDGFWAIAPLLGACALAVTVTQLAQTGVLFTLHPLKPDFKKLDPVAGVKRLLSVRSAWETVKQVAKAAVISAIAWPYVRDMTADLTGAGRVPLMAGLAAAGRELLAMTRAVAWAIVVIAVADYVFQRRQRIRDLRMTRQEIREEFKNADGDPHVKARMRSLQAAVSRNRMLRDVAGASVVVTNPTHYAVAIRYDLEAGGAPTVVATGVDELAARIREAAIEAGVPIVEAPPLARAVYRACIAGDEVPVVLYEAVAKVLVFVRRLKGGIAASASLPLPPAYRVPDEPLEAVGGRNRRRAAGTVATASSAATAG